MRGGNPLQIHSTQIASVSRTGLPLGVLTITSLHVDTSIPNSMESEWEFFTFYGNFHVILVVHNQIDLFANSYYHCQYHDNTYYTTVH